MKRGVKSDVAIELHAPARRRFKRRSVITKGLDDLHQMDLVDLSAYSRENKGFKFMITIIDVYSKFAWAEPLKNKSAKEVAQVVKKVYLKSKRYPQHIQTDKGTEFYNADFKSWLKSHHINHYSTYSTMKASIVERFNRTLRERMWRTFTEQGSHRWTHILQTLLHDYNHSHHRTIRMKPIDVRDNRLLTTVYNKIKTVDTRTKRFRVGDIVRISKEKHQFEKGFTPNWTTELFTVRKVQPTNPTTYLLKDYLNQPIAGGFYTEELQKTYHPDVYLVERVLKRKGTQVYVKWLGFDSSHNSWIHKNKMMY